LITAAAGDFTQLGSRLAISPVVPLVLVAFETTKSEVGLALTGMWAVYALVQFPSGVLADRFGERPLVLVGLGGAAVGTGLLALAPSLPLFGLFALVLGAATGLFFAPISSLLSRLFESRGGALGVLTAGGGVAGVAFPAVGGVVGARFGWRAAIALGAAVALPVVLVSARTLPRLSPANPERSLRTLVDLKPIGTLLARPGVTFSLLLAVVTTFTFQAFSSFFPTFLVEFRGLSTGEAGLAFGTAFAISAVAKPVAGRLSDVTSRDHLIATSVGLTGVGLLVLLFAPGVTGLVGGTVLIGTGVSWAGPLQARVMDQFSDDERGFGFGLVRTSYMLLAAPGSAVVGALTDTGGWVLGYGVVVVLLAGCLLALGTNRALGLGL
jgi:MFS family permease